MLNLFLLIVGFCSVGMFLLCVGVLLRRDGKFRSLHVGQSPAMRSRDIHCVQSMDRMMRIDNPHRVEERRATK